MQLSLKQVSVPHDSKVYKNPSHSEIYKKEQACLKWQEQQKQKTLRRQINRVKNGIYVQRAEQRREEEEEEEYEREQLKKNTKNVLKNWRKRSEPLIINEESFPSLGQQAPVEEVEVIPIIPKRKKVEKAKKQIIYIERELQVEEIAKKEEKAQSEAIPENVPEVEEEQDEEHTYINQRMIDALHLGQLLINLKELNETDLISNKAQKLKEEMINSRPKFNQVRIPELKEESKKLSHIITPKFHLNTKAFLNLKPQFNNSINLNSELRPVIMFNYYVNRPATNLVKGLDLQTAVLKEGPFEFTFTPQNNETLQRVPTQYKGTPCSRVLLSTPLNSQYCALYSIVKYLAHNQLYRTDPRVQYYSKKLNQPYSIEADLMFNGQLRQVTTKTVVGHIEQLWSKKNFNKNEEHILAYELYRILDSQIMAQAPHYNDLEQLLGIQGIVDPISMATKWQITKKQVIKVCEELDINYHCAEDQNINFKEGESYVILMQPANSPYLHAVSYGKGIVKPYNLVATQFVQILQDEKIINGQEANIFLDIANKDRQFTKNGSKEPTEEEFRLFVGTECPRLLKTAYIGRSLPTTKQGAFVGIEVVNVDDVQEKTAQHMIFWDPEAKGWSVCIKPNNAVLEKNNRVLKFSSLPPDQVKNQTANRKAEKLINKEMTKIEKLGRKNGDASPTKLPKINRKESKKMVEEADFRETMVRQDYKEIMQQVYNNTQSNNTSHNFNTNMIETNNESHNLNENLNTIRVQQQQLNKIDFENAKLQVQVAEGAKFLNLDKMQLEREITDLKLQSNYWKYNKNTPTQYLQFFKVADNKIQNISMNFKFGGKAKEMLKSRFPIEYEITDKLNQQIYSYGHPLLRWTVDFFTATAISQIQSKVIVEVAGKIHKNARLCDKKFINYRPKLFTLDHYYWDKHAETINKLRDEERLLMLNEKVDSNFNVSEKIHLMNQIGSNSLFTDYLNDKEKSMLIVDAIYYPGVREGMAKFLRENYKSKAYLVFNVYTDQIGTFQYYDGEGKFQTFYLENKIWIKNIPKDNATGYEHQLHKWPLNEMFAGLDANGVYWTELDYIKTGDHSKTVLVECRYYQNMEEEGVQIFTESTKENTITKGKSLWSKFSNFVLGHDEEINNQIDRLNNIDWTLFSEELYNMAILYYSTMETDKQMREGHISRCLRAILVNKGLIKLNAQISESYLNKLRYNILRAYIYHIINRGVDKKLIDTLKENNNPDWRALILNKPNLYKALFSIGTTALTVSVPIAAPVSILIKTATAISTASIFTAAIGKKLKQVLGYDKTIEKTKNIDSNDYVFGKPDTQMLSPQVPNIYQNLPDRLVSEENNNVIKWQEKDSKELLISPHPNLYNEQLFKTDVEQFKKVIQKQAEFIKDENQIRKEKQIEKAYKRAGFNFDEQCDEFSKARLFRKNANNTLWALVKRQIGHVNKPNRQFLNSFFRYLKTNEYPRWKQQFNTHHYAPLTKEEVLAKKPAGKRELYLRAHQKYLVDQKFDQEMELMMKGDEYQYNDSGKPRILANPSDIGKFYGSYFVTALQQQLLALYPEICIGFNTEQLQDKLTKDYQSLNNPTILVYDHSNHDGHQYEILKEKCEMKFIKECFNQTFEQCIDLPFFCKSDLFTFCTSTKMKMFYKDPETKKILFRGALTNVTSGHPTSTTFGNNLRVINFIRYIKHKSFIKDSEIKINISGDDVIIFIEKDRVKTFKKWFSKVYLFDENSSKPHGLGQLVKGGELIQSDNKIDFLSKLGIVLPDGQVLLNRQIDRGLISGNVTKKLRRDFTTSDYNWAITTNLESWGFSFPVIKEYIQARKNQLGHTLSNKVKSISQAFRMIGDVQFVQHKNSYDFSQRTEFFHSVYNPIVLSQMQSNVNQAPIYIPFLKNVK